MKLPKATPNAAIRAGLSGKKPQSKSKPFVVRAKPMGLRADIDPAGLNRLADDLEVEAFLDKTRRLERSD